MAHKVANWVAMGMLGIMFVLLFTSAWNDSATMDELAHIPAGYSYLTQFDYRLNPEHPPLMKDLSAFPLLFLDSPDSASLNFPLDATAWTKDINGQWEMGRIFLYESGNNADEMLRFARFPIMLLAILFGWLFFKWTRGLYGDKVGLLALFFFAFSPTFLAHSRYVTTDLAAAFGFFIGIAAFVNFLSKRTKKNLIICGVAFGVAQLLKFSLVILAPLYLILGVLWVLLNNFESGKLAMAGKLTIAGKLKKIVKEKTVMIGQIILIGAIGVALIWLVYLPHVWNYPSAKQISDTTQTLQSFGIRPLVNLTVWTSSTPVLRGLGQYMLGVLMVVQRASGGNTTYFMGEIYNLGWSHYFPVLYLFKEHLVLHILSLIALIFGIYNIIKSKEKNLKNIFSWMKENFALVASFIFIAIYWTQAITSPLNIGVRHVLPTFPFIFLLVSRQTIRWIKIKRRRGLLVFALLTWMFLSSIVVFPYYLSYYNALGKGTDKGYEIAVDSNYDWGQDLKRLKTWTDKNLPADERIAIDYFGGGNPKYYFGKQFEPWWSNRGQPEGWLAISSTFLQGAHATPIKNFSQNPENTYSWLKQKTPTARAGTSIFIYKF